MISVSRLIRLQFKIDLHIFYIEGKKNTIADALSRRAIPLARQLAPGIKILYFTPSLSALGASLK